MPATAIDAKPQDDRLIAGVQLSRSTSTAILTGWQVVSNSRQGLEMLSRRQWLIGAMVCCGGIAWAAEPVEVSSPLSPAESLKHFQLDEGLTIELVACEPEVVDPVAIAFGADGSLWVVEMRDYPTPLPSGPSSKIKRLWDKDGDGQFETAVVFADKLLFPTGLLPWKDGLIVTLAGEIAFFADRDGDGRAEFKETWFTGFAQENSQLRHNHPTLGPDGDIYVANGLRGGTVVPVKSEWKAKSQPVTLQGFDFRFDPETGECEAISGNGQFGLTFDDWGNRFVCSNRNPCQHVVLENWHLKLNPHVAVKAMMHDVAAAAENSRIHPISKFWTTSQQHAGQFTAACGVTIFRGDGLGDSYYGNVFVCDPTGNLVHREVMTPQGATFTSRSPYQDREFLATPDTWSRPVNLAHGPDGGLYVVDMYRAVIEHPDWVPIELKNRPDERYGDDRGRIYRIIAKERAASRPTKDQRLDDTTTSEQSALLLHPNAWQRDTATRLLRERWSDFTVRSLLDVIHGNATLQGKVAAIRLCRRFAPEQIYRPNLFAAHLPPRVLEALVATPEKKPDLLDDSLRSRLLEPSDDARVRFQQALWIAGDSPPYSGTVDASWLLPIIAKGIADPWMRVAVLLSIGKNSPEILRETLKLPVGNESTPGLAEFLEDLSAVISARSEGKEAETAIRIVFAEPLPRERLWAVIRGLALGQQRRGKSWHDLAAAQPKDLRAKLSEVAQEAAQIASAADTPTADRFSALRLLKYQVDPAAATPLLAIVLTHPESSVRLAALDSLTGYSSPEIGPKLLETFSRETPTLKRAILDVLLAHDDRVRQLLAALERETILTSEIDPARSARLTNHRIADIREHAQKLFAAANADRAAVLAKYASAARMDGDQKNGRLVFEKNCATCHRVADIGVNVGPDVGDNYNRTPQALLLAILDPNRAVDNNYFGYTVTTNDGRVLTGIITTETASSITLKQPEGKIEVVLRDDIDELKGSGLSLMPVGVEKNVSIQQMADLITFLKNWRYVDGNVPAKVSK